MKNKPSLVKKREILIIFYRWRLTSKAVEHCTSLLTSSFLSEALLGKEHKEQVNYDVKIGDGMDIAIHGENGNKKGSISPVSSNDGM